MKHAQQFLCLEMYVDTDSHTRRLDPSDSHYWLQVWRDSDKKEVDVTKVIEITCKLKKN